MLRPRPAGHPLHQRFRADSGITRETTRKNPIAFGFTNGSWFCLESTRLDNGKLLWQLAQGEPYLRTTFKGTTAELNKVLVDHLAGKGKLPDPVKEEPGFGPEYQPKK